ncbi:MAG TPA: cation transporter [Firmicutes bacterium]|nr:cation transporter [Bacillota bacterium]
MATHEIGAEPQSHRRAVWATQLSTAGLLATALLQGGLVLLTGSAALLADTLHNLLDCSTGAILWVVYRLERRPPTRHLTYGYGRAEDLAGLVILLTILATAVTSAWVAYERWRNPVPLPLVWAVAAAGFAGFAGNELVARYRIKVGKEIQSAALVADGYHARADGWTSLAVLAGALGVRAGAWWADPLAAFGISLAILRIAFQAGRPLLLRAMDGIDGETLTGIARAAAATEGVQSVYEVRARWSGHHILAEVNVGVPPDLTVAQGHELAKSVEQAIRRRVPGVARVTVHVDPATEPGESFHLNPTA